VKVLITGAAGQLGRSLAASAPQAYSIVAATRNELDICSQEQIDGFVARVKPDLIINAAAFTAVDRAESAREEAFRANADAPRMLAAAAAAHRARLIHVSTDFVFDGTAARPYAPDASTHPLSVYGESKLQGEIAVREVLDERAVIVRTAWVYAAEGRNFLNTMLRLMRQNRSVRVVADQVGTPTAADSLAKALWRFAGNTGLSGVFHWTDEGVASWYDFAVAIMEEGAALGLVPPDTAVTAISTSEYPTPARRPPFSVLDKKKSEEALGIRPRHWRQELRSVMGGLALV
jgi:dTDP-4-dehydrorhamnose reductase